ncbi:FMN-binding protein [Acanthopleuribacter pedis]|uniref:FMN-binding protein n=1 Tax=Acanthopleuribacter pedis TaxID=442870 RepID=A0A8J7QFK2_9BACT|nr:FMN-binding protein [Acanthopleuribacter pedis]MBO1318995.1 FMN-binding protein [Acanthopleuribacter pedis]
MHRRSFLGNAAVAAAGAFCLNGQVVWAETFLTVEQAQKVLWGSANTFTPSHIQLTKDEMKAIAKASKVRVRRSRLQVWRTAEKGWFIVDQVIGKHENIDLAVAIDVNGKVKGLEVLTYRETYGHEIRNDQWRAQFHGKGTEADLRLNKEIRNISGATLSCRHVTDGVNRLLHTWHHVLRHL